MMGASLPQIGIFTIMALSLMTDSRLHGSELWTGSLGNALHKTDFISFTLSNNDFSRSRIKETQDEILFVIDGISINFYIPFFPDSLLISEPTDVVQVATARQMEDQFQISITVIPYGVIPATEGLPIAAPGSAEQYREILQEIRIHQGGIIRPGPQIILFGTKITGSTSLVDLFIDGVDKEKVLITEWVYEVGKRVWIIRANQIYTGEVTQERINNKINNLAGVSVDSPDVNKPSTSLVMLNKKPENDLETKVAVSSTSDLPFPSWWDGDCNVNNHPGSFPLGVAYRGVKPCGPLNLLFEVDFGVGVHQYEWQCPELSKRYLYLAYGTPPYIAHGKDVVWNYPGSNLEKVSNGTPGKGPHPGDVLSYGSDTTYGHTSVVQQSNIDSNGNGTIWVIEQNFSLSGTRFHIVSNYYVQSNVTISGWLHDPANGGSDTPPPDGDIYQLFIPLVSR
jgi:hypothetical protein